MDNYAASRRNDEDRSAVVRSVVDRMGDEWSVIVICRLGSKPVASTSCDALDRWTDEPVDVIRAACADYDDRMHTYAG